MLRSLPIDQIAARNMESVAVLKADPEGVSPATGWLFEAGGDDFDDFDGIAVEDDSGGSVGMVRYRGQPEGTLSILAQPDMTPALTARLTLALLRRAGLSRQALEWVDPSISETLEKLVSVRDRAQRAVSRKLSVSRTQSRPLAG